MTHGAISVLAALILGFSFSFASNRYDPRRLLVTEEANAIGTTFLRAAFLRAGAADRFRSTLREYTQARLAAYTAPTPAGIGAMERKSIAVQDVLWSLVVMAARDDPRNGQLGLLTQALNQTIDISEKQAAALRSRVPAAMLGLVIVVSLLSTTLLGARFGRARGPQIFLAFLFCLLFATVITEIVDLDHPQRGLVRVDLTSLQSQLQRMH